MIQVDDIVRHSYYHWEVGVIKSNNDYVVVEWANNRFVSYFNGYKPFVVVGKVTKWKTKQKEA